MPNSQPDARTLRDYVQQLLVDVAQLLDGWHQDGTAWSAWDEEVRQRVSVAIRALLASPAEPAQGEQESYSAAGRAFYERDEKYFVATIEASAQAETLADAVRNVTRFVTTAWPDAADWPEQKSEAPSAGLHALVEKWRAEGARKDTFHATMGIGWKACADELAAYLAQEGK